MKIDTESKVPLGNNNEQEKNKLSTTPVKAIGVADNSNYWQVAMDPADQEKTAFITHSGLFEFSVCHSDSATHLLLSNV